MPKKPCLKVQICSINFWIKKWLSPPHFGTFLKIHQFCWRHLSLCQKFGLWIYQSKSRKESAELGKKTLPGQPVWVSSLCLSSSLMPHLNVEWIGFGWTNSKSDFSPHSTQGSCSDVIWNAAAHNLFVRCMAWSTATGVSSPFLEGFHFVMPKESLLEVSGWVDRC